MGRLCLYTRDAGRFCVRFSSSRRVYFLLLGLAMLAIGGCAQNRTVAHVSPGAARGEHLAPWVFDNQPARKLVTPHYIIYSTVTEDDFLWAVGDLMEGALRAYGQLDPEIAPTSRPLECYLFANRSQWAQFTKGRTGADAAIYLQINRGGYTVRDWYAAYNIGDIGTFSVAAHEGFHQYAARHLESRLPPFLEEGLSCLFEDVRWEGEEPRWDLSRNAGRTAALQKAVREHELQPLEQLIRMHAGQVVNQSGARIAAFYAQGWGLAEFLWRGESGRYRPALRRMLNDATAGRLYGCPPPSSVASIFWSPRSAKPLLEHYLGKDIGSIDAEYQHFLQRLAAGGPDTE